MTLSAALFWIVAGLTGASAVMVVVTQNIVRAAAWLLFTLAGTSAVYFLLGAEFVGAAQLIVYVGGTLVLVVFGVMLTAQGPLRELRTRPAELIVGGVLGAILIALLGAVSYHIALPPADTDQPLPGTAPLGLAFLGVSETSAPAKLTGVPEGHTVLRTPVAYLLPFEIVSVHLLVVL